jgi:thymidylate synthase ThyX
MIKAQVIADSKDQFGNRLTTLLVVMPRYILAEFNTHRMLSKNSASSRAIPFEKMIKSVEENPFIPMAWQKDHKGMQGTEYFDEKNAIDLNVKTWLHARDQAIWNAKILNNFQESLNGYVGVTKQLCNRLLEPFMYHTVLVSATEWENFFALRCPQYEIITHDQKTIIFRSKRDVISFYNENGMFTKFPSDKLEWIKLNKGMADIHMMEVAEAIYDAINKNTPKQLKTGEWHVPFGDDIDLARVEYEVLLENIGQPIPLEVKIATSCAARTSYTTVDSENLPNSLEQYNKDIQLHDRLSKSGHWSPFEHCAQAMDLSNFQIEVNKVSEWSGNFRGFKQYRKFFENENITL